MDFKKLFHGCLEVMETGSGYFPVRFTPKQLWLYGEDSDFKTRSLSTAGVFMEFTTDAQEVSFTYKALLFSRPFIAFDFYENGVLTETIHHPDQSPMGAVTYRMKRPGKVRVKIYLPNTAQMVISNLSLGNWSPVPKEEKKLLFLGDSITQGMTAESPSLTYANILARFYGAEALNQAVGGDRYREETLDENLEFVPDAIFVAYGTNDSRLVDSLEEIDRNVACYYEKLRTLYPTQKIVAITPIWRSDYEESKEYQKKLDDICSLIAHRAAEKGCQVVCGMEAVPHMPSYLRDSFLHPNDIGFSQYALYIVQKIKSLS